MGPEPGKLPVIHLAGIYGSLVILLTLLPMIANSACPKLCSGHGACNKFGACTCSSGYLGADCSLAMCPSGPAWSDMPWATDAAHAQAECSNRGICDRSSGVCSCMKGFSGSACNRMDCPNKCSDAGQCYTMAERATRTTDINGNSYAYATNWDANMIRGCLCDPKFSGYDCSIKNCPTGDDPLTKNQVNQIQLLRCVASLGSFTLFLNGYPSARISSAATASEVRTALLNIPLLTDIKVTFSPGVTSVCSITVGIVQLEFIDQFGNNPAFKAVPDSVMVAEGGRLTVSADGLTVLQDYRFITYKSVVGTKENAVCSNRGLCSADGTCACFSTNGDTYASSNGYGASGTRGDCGFIYSGSTVATCPGQVQCSGHGLCDKTSKACQCQAGWEGGDCSMRQCPKGLAWFDYPIKDNSAHSSMLTCSGAGFCDVSTGTCLCNELFVGQACDRMVCGGGMTCNGHGRCMSMSEIALYAEDNGNIKKLSYGMIPNNAATWDGQRVLTCKCDEGYSGYDCSLRICPTGDDPATWNDHVEVQLVTCKASPEADVSTSIAGVQTGSFTLSFRQHTTRRIPASANANQVKAALEALPNIAGRVDVWFLKDILASNATIPEKTFNAVRNPKRLPQGMPKWAAFGRGLMPNWDELTKFYTKAGTYVISYGGPGSITPVAAQASLNQMIADGPIDEKGRTVIATPNIVCSVQKPGATEITTIFVADTTGIYIDSMVTRIQPDGSQAFADGTFVTRIDDTKSSPTSLVCPNSYAIEISQDLPVGGASSPQVVPANSPVTFTWKLENAKSPDFYRDYVVSLKSESKCRDLAEKAYQCLNVKSPASGSNVLCKGLLDEYKQCTRTAELNPDPAPGNLADKLAGATASEDRGATTKNFQVKIALSCPEINLKGSSTLYVSDTTGIFIGSLITHVGGDGSDSFDQGTHVISIGSNPSIGGGMLPPREISDPNQIVYQPPGEIGAKIGSSPCNGAYEVRLSSPARADINTAVTLTWFTEFSQSANFKGVYLDTRPVEDITVDAVTSPACSPDSSQVMIISFASTHGNLPALNADASNLAMGVSYSGQTPAVTVYTDGASLTVQSGLAVLFSVRGTTENVECNNHGLCDANTGECTCFKDWSASDGAGGPGRLADCGYVDKEKDDDDKVDAAVNRGERVVLLQLNTTVVMDPRNLHYPLRPEAKPQYPASVTPDEQNRDMGPLDLRGK